MITIHNQTSGMEPMKFNGTVPVLLLLNNLKIRIVYLYMLVLIFKVFNMIIFIPSVQ
jgi:hypothetical protein